jgi:DNA-binding Lrp family transcriptional regulator
VTRLSTGHHSPDTPLTPLAEDAAVARIITRYSTEYVLRGFQLLIDTYGDIRGGLLVHGINIANLAHIDPLDEDVRQAAGQSGILPDEMRRPVSVARLAETYGLPFESVRRAVQQLIAVGACERIQGGVIIPGAVFARPEALRAVVANIGNVRKFMRDLHAAGLLDHMPASLAVAAGVGGTMVARLVARQSSEYVQRALQLLADIYGDTRSGVIAQTIIAANTAYLDTRGGEGWRYAGLDENPPDAARRPISIGRVAESLGLPYETTRRHVARLIEAKVCERVRGGVIVPGAVLESPGAVQAMLANVANVRLFARELDASVG